jgi:hypothetical protein
MNVSRSLLASAVVTVSTAVLTGSPAHAGGDPGYDIGTVSIDRTATVNADLVALSGTYACTGAGDRIGSLSFQLLLRDRPPTDVHTIEGLICDGAQHRWGAGATVPGGRVQTGAATFWGGIAVCESPEGPCPMEPVDERVIIIRRSR